MKKALLLPIAAFALAQSASATVIYSQTFSGTNTAPLAGTAPTTTIGGNVWTGNSFVNVDGTFDSTAPIVTTGAVYLKLNGAAAIAANTTYTWTVVADMTSDASTNWLSFGFSTLDNTTDPIPADFGGGMAAGSGSGTDFSSYWFLARQNGQANAYVGPRTSNSIVTNASGFTVGDNVSYQITLETGALVTNSTISMSIGGSAIDLNGATAGTSLSGINASAFDWVGFGRSSAVGRIDSIQLAVIPEPSTLVMVLGALGATLLLRRRR